MSPFGPAARKMLLLVTVLPARKMLLLMTRVLTAPESGRTVFRCLNVDQGRYDEAQREHKRFARQPSAPGIDDQESAESEAHCESE